MMNSKLKIFLGILGMAVLVGVLGLAVSRTMDLRTVLRLPKAAGCDWTGEWINDYDNRRWNLLQNGTGVTGTVYYDNICGEKKNAQFSGQVQSDGLHASLDPVPGWVGGVCSGYTQGGTINLDGCDAFHGNWFWSNWPWGPWSITGHRTTSPAATCNSSNCSGCCQGAVCITNTSASVCGTGGSVCTACTSGQTCTNGSCVTPAECTTDANCAADKKCTNGACVRVICVGTADGCKQNSPNNNHGCTESNKPDGTACGDLPQGASGTCQNGVCTVANTSCSTDPDCSSGYVCTYPPR